MLKLIIVDDSTCKKDLERFLGKHQQALRMDIATDPLIEKVEKWSRQSNPIQNKVALKTNDSIQLVNVNEIIRCESKRNYTKIHLTNETSLMLSKTLSDVEALFSKHDFFRIHKTHLINMDFLHKYLKKEGGSVLMTDGTRIPVALRKKEVLLKYLNQLDNY